MDADQPDPQLPSA
jgi:hypothetical protein